MLVALVEAGRLEDGEGTVSPIGGKPWLPPSALMMLANMLPDRIRGERVKRMIHDENANGPFDIKRVRPDLIFVSYLTTGRLRAYQIGYEARELGIAAGPGGVDPTCHYYDGNEEEIRKFFPSIHIGRATRGSLDRFMTSLMTGNGERVHRALPGEPWEFAPLNYRLIKRRRYRFSGSASLSQGCLHDCRFCAVGVITEGHKVYVKPAEIVAEDFVNLPRPWYLKPVWRFVKGLFPIVIFDDTTGMMPRDQLLWRLSALRDLGQPWFCETTGKMAWAIKKLLHQYGCTGAYIGFENVSEPYGDKNNEITRSRELILWFHDHGMIMAGSFAHCVQNKDGVFYEEPDVFTRTTAFAIENHLDAVQFSIGYPIPCTDFHRDVIEAGLMIDWNPNHSDGSFLVFRHPHISPEIVYSMKGIQGEYVTAYSGDGCSERLSHLRSTYSRSKAKLIEYINTHQIWSSVKDWWVDKVDIDYWRKTAMTRKQYELAIESLRTCGQLPAPVVP